MRFIISLLLVVCISTNVFSQTEQDKNQFVTELFHDFKKGNAEAVVKLFIDAPLLNDVILIIEKEDPAFFKRITRDSVRKERLKAQQRLKKSLEKLHAKLDKASGGLKNAKISKLEIKESQSKPFAAFRCNVNFTVNGKEGWITLREIVYDKKREHFFIMSDRVQGEIVNTTRSSVSLTADDVVVEDVSGDYDVAVPEPMPKPKQENVFEMVEVMPEFPGGSKMMYKYISENIRYPQIAVENRIEGKVYAQFIVQENGALTDIKILRAIGGGCGKEVLRLIKRMPKWKPGKQNGKAVPVRFTLPVSFELK